MLEPSVEVDKGQFTLLEAVAQAASALEIPWLLTGAGGRVLLLEKLLRLPPGRATEDFDFGVMARSWDQYQALKDRIVGTDSSTRTQNNLSGYGVARTPCWIWFHLAPSPHPMTLSIGHPTMES